MSWDPQQYLKFADLRLRPALDLLARIPAQSPASVFDLGCGAGNVTRQLAARWPHASITGLDSSPDMLAEAKRQLPSARWLQADLSIWRPSQPADVIFSNALFHWIKNHRQVFAGLFESLSPGGVLAIQMPRNQQEPSHTVTSQVAGSGPWRERLAPLADLFEIWPPDFYHDLLRGQGAAHIDIWESVYQQALVGPDPVLEWIKGTALRPYLAALSDAPDLQAGFLKEVGLRLRDAYPMGQDGVTLLPFRRLFIVAARK
ncbi:MAG: methyltransferase domain-containing protein [Alphaproteobacteria bacterium]|nr:methyltransferase domain-containing protein [Alphaproteobacteria bacterium]